jgi:hypothetical protein
LRGLDELSEINSRQTDSTPKQIVPPQLAMQLIDPSQAPPTRWYREPIVAVGEDTAQENRPRLDTRKLGRRRGRDSNSDAVRDAVGRWSREPEGAPLPRERSEDDEDETRRAAVEAMLKRRSQADLVAAFGDTQAVENANVLLRQAQDAEVEAAAALARAAKMRAAADEAISSLQAKAQRTQMSSAMAAWSEQMDSEPSEEEQEQEDVDLRAAMQAAMKRGSGEL